MRILATLFCLVLLGVPLKLPAGSDVPAAAGAPGAGAADKESVGGPTNSVFVVGLSPFLDASVKDTVFRSVVRLIVEDLPLNTKLEVYDAYNLESIARVSIPGAKVFNSPKARANQFAAAIGEIKHFLARDNPRPAGPKSAFAGAIRLPQFCDFLARIRPPEKDAAKLPLLLLGSPLYQDAKEPAFSMVDGYYPSDGHLRASREQSVFGLESSDHVAAGPLVHWVYFGDPWMSELHREKVTRFWTLYLEKRGGRLASFSGDLATVTAAFKTEAQGSGAAASGWVADPKQTKPEMLRATRSVKLVDWLTGDAPDTNPPPPEQTTGPLKIGIRWKQDIDLDLYAAPGRDAETLFFQHQRSPEGYYFKDERSSPGREYEYIEFESPVDVRNVRSFVNFYGGSSSSGPRGEVRIEFLNRIYKGSFKIPAHDGNQGRSGASQSNFWTKIPVAEILGLNDAATQSASATN